jgi:acyl-CoA synthetase (AMP-forming)/AMP-acid ligase II
MLLMGEISRLNAAKYPTKPAVVYEDKQSLTYAQLNEEANRLAHVLQSLGVKQGQQVSLLARNRPQHVVSFFACAKIGVLHSPLNYRFTAEELVYVLNDAGSSVLLVDVEYSEIVRKILPQVPNLRAIIGFGQGHGFDLDYDKLLGSAPNAEPVPERPIGGDDVCWVCYTGGTTGMSKGVMLSHNNNFAQIVNLLIADEICHEDVNMVNGALFHVVFTMALPYWYAGCTVVIIDFVPDLCLDMIAKNRVTKTVPVATMLNLLVDIQARNPRDLSSLKHFGLGGAPVSIDTVMAARDAFEIDFVQYFGQTEATVQLTYLSKYDYRRGLSLKASEQEKKRLMSGGRAQHLCAVKIIDDDDNEVQIGTVGEICGRGPQVMKGYWAKDELTAETLRGGWLHTGDMGYMDEDGYVYVVDRKKDMIVSGGENVYSTEVEKAIYRHDQVLECAVIGIPDKKWGEIVAAFVVRKPGATVTENELQVFVRQLISHYKVPKSVSFVESLPKAPTGKIQKVVLRDKYWKGASRRDGGT